MLQFININIIINIKQYFKFKLLFLYNIILYKMSEKLYKSKYLKYKKKYLDLKMRGGSFCSNNTNPSCLHLWNIQKPPHICIFCNCTKNMSQKTEDYEIAKPDEITLMNRLGKIPKNQINNVIRDFNKQLKLSAPGFIAIKYEDLHTYLSNDKLLSLIKIN